MISNPSSHDMNSWLGAILAGVVSAALFSAAISHEAVALLLIAYLAGVPLLLSSLAFGSLKGLAAGAIGLAGTFIIAQNTGLSIAYVLAFALPIFILSILAHRYRMGQNQEIVWYPEGNLLVALTVYPCVMFLAACAYTSLTDVEGGLLGLSTDALNHVLQSFKAQFQSNISNLSPEQLVAQTKAMDQLDTTVTLMARYMPAILGYTWLCLIMFSAFAAQALLTPFTKLIRAAFRMTEINVPTSFLFVIAAAGIGTFITPDPYAYICANMMLLFFLPLIMQGLGVCHAFMYTTRKPLVSMLFFYLIFGVVPGLVLVVAVLGAVDLNFHFRQRFAQLPNPISKV